MERLTPAQYAFRNRVREVANDMRARMGLPPAVWPEMRIRQGKPPYAWATSLERRNAK